MLKTVAYLLFAMLAIAGCETTPVTEESAKPLRAERVYKEEYLGAATSPDEATLTFLRDADPFETGCVFNLYVNLVKIFGIAISEKVTIHLPKGEHELMLEYDKYSCESFRFEVINEQLEAGSRQSYRAGKSTYDVIFERIEP